MEIRENLELVSVEYESDGQKAVMTFLDRERKEVRQVNWNKQVYKDNKFIKDEDKAAKVEGWAQEYFGTTFDQLEQCVGTLHTVYIYDRFNSLYPVQSVAKFTKEMVGEIYKTTVKDVVLDEYAIKIRYDIDGETYESKHTFGTYVESLKEWFVDPQKKDKIFLKFEDKYGVSVADAQSLIGHDMYVEVKAAFGTSYYGDIKKFSKN